MSNLLERAAEFVGISSLSRQETALCDRVEVLLRTAPHLEVTRIGDNVVARTLQGKPERLLIGGHLDTVQSAAGPARVEDEVLWGLGAADMKGTLAVMVNLALDMSTPNYEVTWVFYAREEIDRKESGLREIASFDPMLLQADAAILGEPTNVAVEAGCQGTLRLEVVLGGVSAHAARPFMGVNAISRLSPVLDAIVSCTPRQVEIDGVVFTEQCEVVGVSGGSGGNVIPDSASLIINHRFAPDRTSDEAISWVRSLVEPYLDEDRDSVRVLDVADGAAPHLTHPLLAALVARTRKPVQAKVGWTDVATFAELGVPAANFGAGDPQLAHHPQERVENSQLEGLFDILKSLLTT